MAEDKLSQGLAQAHQSRTSGLVFVAGALTLPFVAGAPRQIDWLRKAQEAGRRLITRHYLARLRTRGNNERQDNPSVQSWFQTCACKSSGFVCRWPLVGSFCW